MEKSRRLHSWRSLSMNDDPWLERWLPSIRQRARGGAFELGCGEGDDTQTLVREVPRVVALDISADALALARTRAPAAEFHRQDLREPFPIPDGSAGVVVASLSLHYFPWPETVDVVGRIHRVLEPNGVLLCRLNSTNDHNFGASGHKAIEQNYYWVNGRRKRFFDQTSVLQLFSVGWRLDNVEELTTPKYGKPKVLWEVVAQRVQSFS